MIILSLKKQMFLWAKFGASVCAFAMICFRIIRLTDFYCRMLNNLNALNFNGGGSKENNKNLLNLLHSRVV